LALHSVTSVTIVQWRDLDSNDDTDVATIWLNCANSSIDDPSILATLQIPGCWYRHGNFRENSALHSCWVAAFDDADSGHGPVDFMNGAPKQSTV
jgi:hypothetical protein